MKPARSIVIVLDNIRSMHNVGSIFRTADAFGVETIYLCGYTPRPPHRDIHKTALGATESVPWKEFEKTTDAIEELKSSGYKIFSVEQTESSRSLHDLSIYPELFALVFGNEVNGVGQEVVQASDACVEVPQRGMKKSLNVSVCVGVVLWHLRTRQ